MAGGGSSKFDSGKKKARIEIIPLIDVIFFLLATFVLFTLSLNKIKSLPVNLPISTPSTQPPSPDNVTLQVSEFTLYWNKTPLAMNDLESQLKQYKDGVADPKILVTGDTSARHGDTIQVLDEIQKAGFKPEQFSIETKTRGTGQ